MKNLVVRQARGDEIEWINERYDEVDFVHSELPRDFIAIAEVDGVRAGLGRIVPINDSIAELGGMFVRDHFRGRGVAEKIVHFLLQNNRQYSRIFCLPFTHLSAFYSRFGFEPHLNKSSIPELIRKKHDWCNQQYPQPTLLYSLKQH